MFMAHANIGIASVHYNYQNAVTIVFLTAR